MYPNIVEELGLSPELTCAYADFAPAIGLFPPLYPIADKFIRLAWETIRHTENDAVTLAWISLVSGLYFMYRGRWNDAEDILMRGYEASDRVGQFRRSDECRMFLAFMHYLHGDFTRGKQVACQAFPSVHWRGEHLNQFHLLCARAEDEIRLAQVGYTDEVSKYLQQAEALLPEKPSPPDMIRLYGTWAEMRLHQGDMDHARKMAERALQVIRDESRPTTIWSFAGYAGVCRVFLVLWETAQDGLPSARKRLQQIAFQACHELWKFARVFPVCRPRAHLWQGLYEWLAEKPRKAHKHWLKSLDCARQSDMPYEQGLAHCEIGRHLPENDTHRLEHLNQAVEIFERLGAAYDLKRAQETLK